MFDFDVFAVISPISVCEAAVLATRLRANNDFRHSPLRVTEARQPRDISRDTTAEAGEEPERQNDDLLLRFDDLSRLKYAREGWRFGRSSTSNDVVLRTGREESRALEVSRQHFCIAIDDNLRIVLRHTSVKGMSVGHDGQNEDKVRCNFTWILALEPGEQHWNEVTINIPTTSGFCFKISFPHHHSRDPHYIDKLQEFVRRSKAQPRAPDTLQINSGDPTQAASGPISGGKGRMKYTAENILGQGGFGIVRKVVDLEDGQVFAVKELITYSDSNLDEFRKEVQMMMENKHPNVVQVIEFDEGAPKPNLTMEYCPLGSLRTNPPRPTAINDIVSILRQVLMGLDHMHRRKFAHRDLKPDNILVRSTSPLSIAIADFGFAKHFSDKMNTCCGTPLFTAPEVVSSDYEGPLVDIWSAGIMMLYFLRMLPSNPPTSDFRRVEEYAKKLRPMVARMEKSNSALDRLLASMLREDPLHRLNANQCLLSGHAECLFQLSGSQYENGPAYGGPKPKMPAAQSNAEPEIPQLSSSMLRHIADQSFNPGSGQGPSSPIRNTSHHSLSSDGVRGTAATTRHLSGQSLNPSSMQGAPTPSRQFVNQTTNLGNKQPTSHSTDRDPYKDFLRSSKLNVSNGQVSTSDQKTARPHTDQATFDSAFFQIHPGNSQAPQRSAAVQSNLNYGTETQQFLKSLPTAQTPMNLQKNSLSPKNFVDPKLLVPQKGVRTGHAVQAPSGRSDRSWSPVPANNRNDRIETSRVTKPGIPTTRVTRSAAALERAAHQLQPNPASVPHHTNSREMPEKKAGGISRLWGRK